ncbi:MAG: glycosyltransferase family 4 protein [Butyrivibrio sp.]|nr:glycosyltransferase family 4 protein [Butyrivibrio sp.]
MLGHKRVPSREGGVEVVVTELSVRMAKLGHNVTCYNRKGHHVAGEEYDSFAGDTFNGVRLINVPTINRKGFAAATSSVIGAIKAAFGKYDVVHFHAEGPCAAMGITKLMGKRCIATIHGLDHMRQKWSRFASAYIMMGEKAAVKHADEIIVLSKNVQKYFMDKYGRETVYIPNGVTRPVITMPHKIKSAYGLEKDDYILYLGRLVPEKGLEYLIKAFMELDTDKKLVVAGSSSDTHEYVDRVHELAKNDDRIIFTGFVQGTELSELLSNSYVYVIPSDLEGMPLTLLEAMSYGNCCLTSDIPECIEVCRDKAVSFRRGDIEDLREKLGTLIKDKNMVDKYRAEATQYVCERYDWDRIVENTLKLYRGER